MSENLNARFSIVRVSILLLIVISALCLLYKFGRPLWTPIYLKIVGERTVGDVLKKFEEEADQFWEPLFADANVNYPPDSITLLGFKEERSLEVWAKDGDSTPRRIVRFLKTSKSGTAGPKRREYDRQVPEGMYEITGLNPNSTFHLSMKVGYPNEWDEQHASEEDKSRLGGDIFIHGGGASIGCIAIGNDRIEKLFVLVAKTKRRNADVIIAPFDLREEYIPARLPNDEPWYSALYENISKNLQPFTTPSDE
jgi:murein L,D-transpeptidase YafK